jgi:lipopolysaccharide/colanic/teichoic acid biosynthesis glycosyltransferase
MYNKYFKRIFDIVLSLMALILLSPFFLILACFVRIKLGVPVFFKQLRPGYHEKIFTIYKFRSMTNTKDKDGNLLPDADRMTNFGTWLRSSSFDELPEIWNILKGDMSIVGPRPQLVRDMVFMTREQRQRHSVRPGLTGLAQINGRNAISWEEKLLLDSKYMQHISFINDLKILFGTIGKIIKREDVNELGMVTAEDFGEYLLKTNKITIDEYKDGLSKANVILNSNGKKDV